jgi:hypothetical protein
MHIHTASQQSASKFSQHRRPQFLFAAHLALFICMTICTVLRPFYSIAQPASATPPSPALTSASPAPIITFNAYVDVYWATDNDFTTGADTARRARFRQIGFVDIAREEFQINTAQITANLNMTNVRGKITLHYGTLPFTSQTLFSAGFDVGVIQEANIGVQALDGLWIDGGFFLTHIGNEALMPKDNLLSSHAIVTTFEPFYQAGFKVGYTFSDKLEAQLHLLNGYGIINDNNDDKSVGLYVVYKPADVLSLSYAGVYGNERNRGTPAALRLFHNINAIAQAGNLTVKGQVDIASEERLRNNGRDAGSYIAGQVTAKYMIGKFGVSVRGEYFNDADNMLASSPLAAGLMGGGATVGIEFKPMDNAYIRAESRYLSFDRNKNRIFLDGSKNPQNTRTEFAVGFGVWF